MSDLERTLAYHERTKHRFERYAASLGYLDWATQPDPFRRYPGAREVPLAFPVPVAEPTWDALFRPGALAALPFGRELVERVLHDSLALSAWKEHQGNRWALRVNPSSGNLHPTEAYVVLPAGAGLLASAGVAHYAPREHALEVRAALPPAVQDRLPGPGFCIGLTSILWREAWKYGERSFRYCQHDTGHALAAIAIAAGLCGWSARLVQGLDDEALAALLGVADRAGPEREHPECLILLSPAGTAAPRAELVLTQADVAALRAADWQGVPNALSREHHDWPVLAEVAEATRGRGVVAEAARATPGPALGASFTAELERGLPARRLVHQRRSAVAMDGESGIGVEAFATLLARVRDRSSPPLAALPWRPAIDLVFFVHRVVGLEPGLYLLLGDPARAALWRAHLRRELGMDPVAGLLGEIGLVRIIARDVRREAALVSCHQEIASDGAFAVAMVAEFEARLRADGPEFYRRLHWEAGAIGQVLYLEAEALGVRGTGIGCFFDDAVHELLGFRTRALQTVYHFTIGGAVDDPRLRTLAPYAHRAS